MEHFLQNAVKFKNYKNKERSTQSKTSSDSGYTKRGDASLCSTGSCVGGTGDHRKGGCPAPQQKPLGCLGAAKVLRQIQFSCFAAKPRSHSGGAQRNHLGQRS